MKSEIKTLLNRWYSELKEIRHKRDFCQEHGFKLEQELMRSHAELLDMKIIELENATKINRDFH